MSKEILVEVGRYKVASNPTSLKCVGLGSCLAIVLYDRNLKRGGLAHTMLPEYEEGRDQRNPIKYVDTAIYVMLDDLVRSGSEKKDIVAKISGGAQMFSYLGPEIMNVGDRNVSVAKKVLKKENIRLAGKDTGGNSGRTVILDTTTGSVIVRMVSRNEEIRI